MSAEETVETNDNARAVIWDLDGVIADSAALHLESWRAMMAELGQELDEEAFHKLFGMINSEAVPLLLKRPLTPEEVQRISSRKEAIFRSLVPGRLRPIPGALEWIARLRAEGWRQAVASSAPRPNIVTMFDALGLQGAFDAVICGEDLPAGKPDPAVFLAAARAIGVPPARCIVVEDAVVGVAAARRAGMKCIAVTTTHPASSLSDADLIVAAPAALPNDAFARLLETG